VGLLAVREGAGSLGVVVARRDGIAGNLTVR